MSKFSGHLARRTLSHTMSAMGPRLLLTPLPWPAVATGRMPGLPMVFVILLFLDEAMKVPLKGVFPAQCEPCTPSAEQPARLCPLNFFIDFLIPLPGRQTSVKSLAPVLQDMSLSIPWDSLAGSWVSLSPGGSRQPGGKNAGGAGVRSSVTIILSLPEPQTYEWPLS